VANPDSSRGNKASLAGSPAISVIRGRPKHRNA
jgi:hypothetical protein